MSISQNFPEEGPTLNLNFAGSRTLDPRITFTRTSSATYMGRDGLVKIAPANSARFDHLYNPTTGEVESLGLLVEEARSNLIINSEAVSTWTISNMIPTGNSVILPNGVASTEVEYRGETEDPNSKLLRPIPTGGIVAGETFVFSIFLKAGTESTVNINIQNNTATENIRVNSFNMLTGEDSGILGNATNGEFGAIKYPNGWWRVYIRGTFANDATGLQTVIRLQGFSNQVSVTTSFSAWGANLEKGAFPTSYIPTGSSTATRTADNASITGSNFIEWYNQSEGTIMWNGRYNAEDINLQCYSIDPSTPGGDLNNRIALFGRSGLVSGAFVPRIRSSGDNFDPASVGTPTIKGTLIKTALSYSIGSVTFTEGITSQIVTSSPTSLPTVSLIKIGADYSGTQFTNGTISQLTYYPRRLTNAQLVTLTR
jgi:hypothetical protein